MGGKSWRLDNKAIGGKMDKPIKKFMDFNIKGINEDDRSFWIIGSFAPRHTPVAWSFYKGHKY